ncbi:MAG: M28 family peptidase [Bacteroidales bacterium]|nr:M28 family peptidase [Bacteroidales bacterium]
MQISVAQDLSYVRSLVDTLSAPGMFGRGYVNDGDKIAANFIKNEFKKMGVQDYGNGYFQYFTLPMNTFPQAPAIKIDHRPLTPGEDFVVLSSSPSVSGTFKLLYVLADSAGQLVFPDFISKVNYPEVVLVTDINQRQFEYNEKMPFAGLIFLVKDKVWWHVSNGHTVLNYFALQVKENLLLPDREMITARIKNSFIPDYPTQNVIGFIEGREQPDSFYVLTAHYDHLGSLGPDVYFPGANDNASGTAMILDLARHFSLPQNQPEYSIAFMAFGAEEAGLLGSGYYAEHPLFPLDQIKFLLNLDMVGSGSEGIKVVNGTVHKQSFNLLVELNEEKRYLKKVSPRTEAANSDHYPFHAKGVPSFFIYTLGEECKEYHNINDTPENLPFTAYEGFFNLIIDFINTL